MFGRCSAALFAAGSTTTLGLGAGGVMAVGGLLLLSIDRRRFIVVHQFQMWPTRVSADAAQHA